MLGNRTGLQPWGRDRLAQCWYEHAETALEKGDRQKAIMFTDWALNTQAQYARGHQTPRTIDQHRLHEADENSLHDFVRNIIWKDRNEPVNQGGGHYPPEPAADGGPQVPADRPGHRAGQISPATRRFPAAAWQHTAAIGDGPEQANQ